MPDRTTCLRVPLLGPLAEFRRYTVAIDGYRAGQPVHGGSITCTPKFIRSWRCAIE